MIKSLLRNANPFLKLLQLIVVFLILMILTLLVSLAYTKGQVVTDIHSLKILQLIQAVGIFLLPPFVVFSIWSDQPFKALGLNVAGSKAAYPLVILLMLIAIPFINLLSSVNQQLTLPGFLAPIEQSMRDSELRIDELTQKMLNVHEISQLMFNILLISVIPAISEELFFRATIQKIFTEWKSATLGIWMTAFVFSAIHMQFYGFVPRMLLGALFGYLYVWSGSLWLPIVAHFINNVTAIIFYYLKYNGYPVFDIDTVGSGTTLWLGLLSGLLVVGMIYVFSKYKLRFHK